MNDRIRVLIVDDHESVRVGLVTLLAEEPGLEIVGSAADGEEAIRLARQHCPDIILLDLVLPDIDGIEATQRILASCDQPAPRVIVLTSFVSESQVRDAIRAGATGYLLKDVLKSDLLRAIHAAARGEPALHPEAQRHLMRQIADPPAQSAFEQLTPRERDVLRGIARGDSNKEIAADLNLTEGTVKGYVSSILAKLEVADRTQAALFAVRHRVFPPE
jgi:NarL family two-component system response regulator LiaR